LVEASEAAICNVLPGQMGYSSSLSDRKDVTRVDCRIEDVVYLVPLMDGERTCVWSIICMSADSHALATISARPTVTMTFVVQTAAARQAANANGTNSRRLTDSKVSLSVRSHGKGVRREIGPSCNPRLLRPAINCSELFCSDPRRTRA
jgi:hypothetical protein